MVILGAVWALYFEIAFDHLNQIYFSNNKQEIYVLI